MVVLSILSVWVGALLPVTISEEVLDSAFQLPQNDQTLIEPPDEFVGMAIPFQAEAGEVYTGPQGDLSITTTWAWGDPSVRTLDGTEFAIFALPEFDVGPFESEVRIWAVDDGEISVDAIIEAEAVRSGMTLDRQDINVEEGEVTAAAFFVGGGSIGGESVLVVHKTDAGYAAVVLAVPEFSFVEAVLIHGANLQTIRYAG